MSNHPLPGGTPPPPPPRRPVSHDANAATSGPRRRPGRAVWLIVAAAVAVLVVSLAVLVWRPAPDATSAPTTPTPSAPTVPTPSSPMTTPPPTSPPEPATASPSTPAPPAEPAPSPGTALAAVDQLVVAAHEAFDGYDRDVFAYRSVDLDRNGCDVRNDVLRRDLHDVMIRPGTNGCVVESGTLVDPYTGVTMAFLRGSDTSGQVQIDHVVALANAWVTGAQDWDANTLERFGNDPLNLLAVDGPANQSKGADDAAEWLPPNAAFRCDYVALQVAVKTEYDLTVTAAEREAMVEVLQTCPTLALPTAADTATP